MDSKISSLLHELSNGHGEIIMDTASLMEVDRLNYMVENYKPILIQNRLSIIVPGVVCQELVRHLTSDNTEKKEKANEALKVIRNNGEMFAVESAEYSPDEVRKAFADREILLRLSSVRATRRQLLITNDRKLSRDAYHLNQIESCSGKQVFVYYLSCCGNLCECDCPNTDKPEKVIVEKEPIYIEVEKNPQMSAGEIFGFVLASVSIFGAGYVTCRYGRTAMNSIKSMF